MRKVKIVLMAILMILLGGTSYFFLQKEEIVKDSLRFKEEYESLNNTIRESDGALYNPVSIDEKNPIKYIGAKEAVEMLKNKTGIIYFGASWCPWCRNAIQVLFDVAKEKKIDVLYYVDMDKVRNIYEVKEGELVKTQQEGYYELLEALDSILGHDTYKIDKEGTIYDTGEKRIYMPLVVGIHNGSIVDYHVGTVSLQEDQTKYSALTEEQYKQLFEIYEEMIAKTYTTCSEKSC